MSINDFSYESQANKGIINGQINYYVVLQYRMNALISGDKGKYAIPPLNAVLGAFYFPYLEGETEATSTEDRTKWINNDELTGNSVIVKYPTNMKITSVNGFDIVENPVSGDTVSGVGYLQPEKILSLPEAEVNKLLFQFDAYPTVERTTEFNWMNESKCFQYPFRYLEINDGLNGQMFLEPQLLSPKNNEFRIRHSLNPNGTYDLYVKGYKGDDNGISEKLTCGGLSVPVAKDTYLNYLYENKNQRELFQLNQLTNTITSLASGNIGGMMSVVNAELNRTATESDMKNIPPTISYGGNYIEGLTRQEYLQLIPHRVNDDDMNKIALFFHQYGYAQNQLMQPSFKGRKYWNYLQTADCHLKVPNCPKEHLQQLKQIFDNGVTVWHKANGEMFENTEKDNVEL